MTLLWALDLSKADCVSAGMNNYDYNRQTAAGNGASSGLPWPLSVSTAPDGRRAINVPLPDQGRRNEMVPAHTEFSAGNSAVFSTAFWIPSGFPPGNVGSKYQLIEQLRQGESQGSPPVAFEVRDGRLRITGGYGMLGAPTAGAWAYDVTIMDPCPLDRWLPLTYRVNNFSTTAGGSTLDVWLGRQVLLSGGTIPPPTITQGTTYRKVGYYRDPANPAGQLWLGPTQYGTQFATVDVTDQVWLERQTGTRASVA